MANIYPDADPRRQSGPFEREPLPAAAQPEEPSIAQLLGDLVADAQTLVRKEFELARHEINVEITKAKQGAISLGIGIGIAAVGGIMLLLMFVNLLVAVFEIPLWVSYLIVGGILLVAGLIMLSVGANRVKEIDPVPRDTITSVRQDVETITTGENPSSDYNR